jgi:hypothetical protein
MNKLVALVAAVVLTGAAEANGQEDRDLLAEFGKGFKEFEGMALQQRNYAEENAKDDRLRQVLVASHDQQKADLAAKDKAALARANERRQGANDLIQGWNLKCGEQYVGKLSEGAFSACTEQKGQLDPVVIAIRAKARSELEKYEDEVRAPGLAKLKLQADGIGQVEDRMRLRSSYSQQLQIEMEKTAGKVEALRTRISQDCRERASEEQPAYCSNVRWDGQKPRLPALTDATGGLINTPKDD